MNSSLSSEEQELPDANQAHLVSSARQHELTERAERAETATRLSEERFRSIFEQSVAGIAECDLRGRFLCVNERFCEIVGRTAEELCSGPGLRMQDVTHPDDLARSQSLFDQMVASGRPFNVENRYVLRNGSATWASTSVSLVRTWHGVPQSAVAVCLDITEQKRAEAERGLLGQIVASSDDAIVSKDLDGCITSWNQGAERLFGYAATEVIGKSVTLLIPPDRSDEEPEILERIRSGQAVDHYETVRRRKDGSLLNISLTVSPIRDAAGRIIGAAKIARDITERKRGEEQVRRGAELLNFLIDRSPTGFYIVDADFRISHLNADSQARAFRNVNPAIGRRLDDAMRVLWPEPLATEIIAIFRHTLETGEPYRSPGLVSPRADVDWVETYEWQLERTTMPDGRYAVVCYYYDTTRLRQAEHALREADRRKDEFLAMLGHELRNPLAAMASAIQLSQAPNVGEGERTWINDTLARQTEQLRRLVDDLLDLARITHERIELKREPLVLGDQIQRTVDSVRPLIERARHQLSLVQPQEPLWVSGDSARLAQVLENLLTNAAKYTPDGGRLAVRISREGGQAVIAVQDNGIGLAPEMQSRVFDLFAQAAQGLDRSQGGLGIGLTLVRRLVELHGGSVSVRSDGLGRGSEFTVRLPAIEPPARARGTSSPAQDRPVQPLRILIVDDNRDAARTLAMLLKSYGHITEVAYDGRQALAVAEQFQPAVALLDLGLPEINGFDLAGLFLRKTPEIFLVAISGYGQAADLARSHSAGFAQHFVKPVELKDLLSLLNQRAAATVA